MTPNDKEIISYFCKCPSNSVIIFEISGHLIYICEVLNDLKNAKDVSENLKVAVLLWLYVNLYELVLQLMTDAIYYRIKDENDKKDSEIKEMIKLIKKRKENKDHLEAEKIVKFLRKNNLKIEDTFLEKGRLFRNKIGHANIFYDDCRKKIILSNGKSYTLEEMRNEFEVLYMFLLEWLFKLNNESTDISSTMGNLFSRISNELRKIGRSGNLTRKYTDIIVSWKKDFSKLKP